MQRYLRLKILWHNDDDTEFPASLRAVLAGNIQLSIQKMMTLKWAARRPSSPVPIEDFREFPLLSMQKDISVNISATAEAMPAHRSLPELGPVFLGVCDFRQTKELLVFHAPFMGKFWQSIK